MTQLRFMIHTAMTSSSPELLENVYSELGMEVPVCQIDHELRKLWEQDDARANASLINLVVYSEKPNALLENSRIIQNLTREHACRAILVAIDRDEPSPSLRAWITAHCHLAAGHKSVCCEQISFRLTGKVTGRFRNTVFSHLNSDLPLIFWWQGELSEILTERLVSVIDRLIVDSSTWQDPLASLEKIQETAQANPDLILQDLAWTRSLQFRLAIANLFDDPAAQELLPRIERIQMQANRLHRQTALQLLAWLAVQAGWKIHRTFDEITLENSSGNEIAVDFEELETGPAMQSLILHAQDASVRICQPAGSIYISKEITSGSHHASSLAPIGPEGSADLVALQLARGGKNSLYQKILPGYQLLIGY